MRLDDARGRPGVVGVGACPAIDHARRRRQRRHRVLRLHEHDLVAAGLELASSSGAASAVACWKSCISTMPLPCFFKLRHHRLDDLLGLAHLEVEGVHVGREDGDVALAEIGDQLRRMPQRREAEERRGRSADRPVHGADALLDLVLGLLDILGDTDSWPRSWCDQVWVPIVMPAAATCLRMSGARSRAGRSGRRSPWCSCAASAASTAGVLCGHGPSSKVSTTSPLAQEVVLLEVLEAEAGPPVVSISTMRATPSAFGLPQVGAALRR